MNMDFNNTLSKKRVAIALAATIVCVVVLAMLGVDHGDAPSKFDAISMDRIISLELSTDVSNLIENKDEELDQKGRLTYLDPSGARISEKVEVAARGNSRKEICSIPPIRLKFKKKKLQEAGLAEFRTLKMVLPCQDDRPHRDYTLREALCYQLYGVITDKSFRTQLAKLDLQDLSGTQSLKSFAFLIEHEDELARRIGGEIIKTELKELTAIDQESYNLLVLFQFMIGNTDWNMVKGHNLKLISLGADRAPIPVPYDFDQSGLVDAAYSVPHPSMPISNSRARLFQWRGKDQSGLYSSIQRYLERKSMIMSTIAEFPGLNESSRKDILNYVADFFEVIEREDAVNHLVVAERRIGASKI